MRYSYAAAWSVVGGIMLPNDCATFELFTSDKCRFVLMRDPESLLANFDRGSALGRMMLKFVVGQPSSTGFDEAIRAEIAEIQAERRNKQGGSSVLVFEANGDTDTVSRAIREDHGDFMVTFDMFDKDELRRRHKQQIETMKLALCMLSDAPSKFSLLTDDAYLTNDEARIIYSVNFKFSAEATLSRTASIEQLREIPAHYAKLETAGAFASVQRLFSQMAEFRADKLRAFLFGYAALEILISKLFKRYEGEFLAPLTSAGQPTLRERFLDRLKEVMKDKYRLTDKFVVVAALLFPNAAKAELEADYERFRCLKDRRDTIAHGDEFVEEALPVNEVSSLLLKYIKASIER